MTTNTLILVYGAIFLGALLFVEGLYYLIRDIRGDAVNRRLRLHAMGVTGEAALLKLRRRGAGVVSGVEAFLYNFPGVPELDRLLGRAGSQMSVARAIALSLLLSAGAFIVLRAVVQTSIGAAVVLALLIGMGLPLLILWRVVRHRLRKIEKQLPDAIDMMVRSLHAGHPVATALGLVSREAGDPIGTEFGIVFDEMTYGLDLGDALQNLADRVPLRELHFMTVSIRLQHTTGGNLAETLAALSQVIRERARLRDKVKALSAEGRLSAYILAALPFIVGGGIYLMNPRYYGGMPEDLVLTAGMATALTMLVSGIVIMFRIVNFRV